MGQNPMPIVIPCHRVLAAGGKLGGFTAPGGAATKQKLLALEGIHFDDAPASAPHAPPAAGAFIRSYFIVSTMRPRTLRSLMSRSASANCSIG